MFLNKSGFTIIFVAVLLLVGSRQEMYAQETSGKKLETSSKPDPSKINNKKVKTSKKVKAKGNPNKGKVNSKVVVGSPNKWNLGKIMRLKSRKSDYQTRKYDPDKAGGEKPGSHSVELDRPVILFDDRVTGKGKILVKESKRPDKPKDDKLFTTNKPSDDHGKVGGDKLRIVNQKDKPKGLDNDKLFTVERKDKPGELDNDKLFTIERKDKPQGFDNDKLFTVDAKGKPKEMDNDKLQTHKFRDPKKNKYDYDKLNTVVVKDPKKADYDYSKLETIKVDKGPSKKPLHDDRLLTHKAEMLPNKKMKKNAEDIADWQGDYTVERLKGKNYHPSARHVEAKRTKMTWLKRTQLGVSSFWSKLWNKDQPDYLRKKPKKPKRDKNEGQIWDNTVHPSEWLDQGGGKEPAPESGNSEENEQN